MGFEEEEAEPHKTGALDFLARLLDPHLDRAARRSQAKPQWSRRKAFAFILAASLALWALIILGLVYLIRLF